MEVVMFTVRSTLFFAVWFGALALIAPLGVLPFVPRNSGVLAALAHVWLLLGHLHLRGEVKAGRPGVWYVLPLRGSRSS